MTVRRRRLCAVCTKLKITDVKRISVTSTGFLDNGDSQAGENLGFEKASPLGLGCVETVKTCARKTVGMVSGVSDPFRIWALQSRGVRSRQHVTTARLSETHNALPNRVRGDGVDLSPDRSRFGETAKNLRTCPRKSRGHGTRREIRRNDFA